MCRLVCRLGEGVRRDAMGGKGRGQSKQGWEVRGGGTCRSVSTLRKMHCKAKLVAVIVTMITWGAAMAIVTLTQITNEHIHITAMAIVTVTVDQQRRASSLSLRLMLTVDQQRRSIITIVIDVTH